MLQNLVLFSLLIQENVPCDHSIMECMAINHPDRMFYLIVFCVIGAFIFARFLWNAWGLFDGVE